VYFWFIKFWIPQTDYQRSYTELWVVLVAPCIRDCNQIPKQLTTCFHSDTFFGLMDPEDGCDILLKRRLTFKGLNVVTSKETVLFNYLFGNMSRQFNTAYNTDCLWRRWWASFIHRLSSWSNFLFIFRFAVGGGLWLWLNARVTSATIWPLVPAPDVRRVWSTLWNEKWQKKPNYPEKTCPNSSLSTINSTWPQSLSL
jgi:hypothetical protein